MDDADGDFDSCGDGADGFAALAAGEDGGAFVVVDHGAPGLAAVRFRRYDPEATRVFAVASWAMLPALAMAYVAYESGQFFLALIDLAQEMYRPPH